MMIAQQRQWLLILMACVVHGCATFDAPTPSKQPLTGLIATPVSYYSTPKAKFLASKYKDNLDHITERIVRNSATSQLQFANNISSIGGIGFFTHSAAKTADERYLEVVLGTPETFETKGDYSEKVNRLFALYGRDLLATLAGDSQIFADQDVAGYGLNLTWRTAQAGTQTNRILMARAILYFRKERVASFLQRQLSPQELLGDAVIFALEEDGPLNLVSFQPRETQPDFRPPIREDNLASGGAPIVTGSGSTQGPVTEKADRSQEKLEAAPVAVPVTQEPIEIAAAQENAVAESASKVDIPVDAAAVTVGAETSSGPLEKSSGTKAGSVEQRPPAAEKKPAASDTPPRTAASPVISLSERATENTAVEATRRGSAVTRIPVDNAQRAVSAPKLAPEQSLPSSKPAEVAQAEPQTPATEPGAEAKAPIERVTDMTAPTVDKQTRSDAPNSRAQSEKATQSSAAPAQPVASGRTLERPGELSATSSDAQRETAQPAVSTASSTAAAGATTAAAIAEIKPPGPLMNRPEEQKISRKENTKAPAPRPESQPTIISKAEELPAAKSSEKTPSSDADTSGNAPNKSGSAAGRSETPVEIARAETARAIPAAPQTAPAPQVSVPATPSQASKEAIKVPAAAALPAAPAKSPEPVKPPTTDTAAAADTISRSASKPADAARPAPAHEARAVATVPDQLALLRKPPAPAAVEQPLIVRPAPKSLEGYIIQIAFADKDKAQSWAEKMAQRGYAISVTETGEAGALRVRLGNFTLRDDAERQLRSFRQEGLSGIIINLPQAFRPEARSSVP
ncbi:MAG TPA: SPOR domain-containing protein [Candidatus Binatia bacterium]|nr:SPOR domain-containing protein [Candidatus Binatia bacterium]